METMNVQQAADFLKISDTSVERMAGEGIIKGAKVGKQWVFFKDDLADYLRRVIDEQTAQRRDLLAQGKPPKIKTAIGARKGKLPVLPDLPVAA